MDGEIHVVGSSKGGECRVGLAGRITIDSSPELRTYLLERLESTGCQGVTVDFYDVIYIDTSGLAMLVEVLKFARRRGKGFSLSGLRDRPRYLLEATRLLHLFHEVDRNPPQLSDLTTGSAT
jgi:anti-sigma B factor antagonist